ncbi:N-glycosylase/DNA lyase [Pyrolobus fumarii 1A]|uniref:N-glycosylase/DNA lyase n=1 Tax=Pyrolobus fumarii (strain DSM 11204 / 1A) TaxID=694429 RepID=G0EC96_PYRF1|nr:N-glycosylase/DNA lyase [Pyrolobus fumarii]AEM39466.1 N-glycosylase/DNA lyase [Pyrolobus fumarii 1A]
MSKHVNASRIARVASVLRKVSSEALDAAEANDPQFQAVVTIAGRHGEAVVAIVVANAVVSYRLNMHGEEYWTMYGRFWSTRPTPTTADEVIKGVLEFMREVRVPVYEQKASRLRKVYDLISELIEDPRVFTDLELLYKRLVKSLGRNRYQKTSAFAAKMAYYAFRALDREVTRLDAIPVPLDRRFAVLTATSGIIPMHPDVIYTRLRDVAEQAWRRVSQDAMIPPVRLDTLLWLPARSIEPVVMKGLIGIARDEFAHKLVHVTLGRIDVKLADRIAEEILYTIEWL